MPAPDIFLQVFSEKLALLEETGWQVQYLAPSCTPCLLWLDIDALCRIADNLTSNLQKYADPAQPVCFEVTAEDDRFCVCLSNAVCTTPQGDSHGVGLKNVAALMERMHGQSSYTIESRTFCITLHFSR